MSKKDNVITFIDEIYSNPYRKNYPTNEIIYNHIEEIWSVDLLDMSHYKISNNKLFRYIFVIFDNFSKHTWCIPLKNRNTQTITDEFSKNRSISKRKAIKIESDRGKQFYNSIFQKFMILKNIQH